MFSQLAESWVEEGGQWETSDGPKKEMFPARSTSMFGIAARFEKRPWKASWNCSAVPWTSGVARLGCEAPRWVRPSRLCRFQTFERLRAQCREILERCWCVLGLQVRILGVMLGWHCSSSCVGADVVTESSV